MQKRERKSEKKSCKSKREKKAKDSSSLRPGTKGLPVENELLAITLV